MLVSSADPKSCGCGISPKDSWREAVKRFSAAGDAVRSEDEEAAGQLRKNANPPRCIMAPLSSGKTAPRCCRRCCCDICVEQRQEEDVSQRIDAKTHEGSAQRAFTARTERDIERLRADHWAGKPRKQTVVARARESSAREQLIGGSRCACTLQRINTEITGWR